VAAREHLRVKGHVAVLSVLLVLASCDAGPTVAADDGGATCDAPQSACGGTCVSLQDDAKHCGECNQACDAGDICRAGACINPGPSHAWSKRFGGETSDGGGGLAIDGQGNVLVTGWWGDAGPRRTILVASWAADGSERWSKTFGGSDHDEGWDIAVDAQGNAYVVGRFDTPTDFGGKKLKPRGADGFLLSLAPDGSHRWSTAIGSESKAKKGKANFSDAATVVVIAGDLFVGGYYGPVVDGGDDPTLATGGAVYVARYGVDGTQKWMQSFPATGLANVSGLVLDDEGNIYATGVYYKEASFGDQKLSATAPKRAGFLAALDGEGKPRWARSFESSNDLRTERVAVIEDGLLIAGWSTGAIDFGGVRVEGESNLVYLVAFGRDGTPSWSQALPEHGSAMGEGVATAVDDEGIVYLTGVVATADATERPTRPVVLALDPPTDTLMVKPLELEQTTISDVRVGSDGSLYMTGSFLGSADFGGGALTASDTDGFVVRYGG
jgi:hypothetical protein